MAATGQQVATARRSAPVMRVRKAGLSVASAAATEVTMIRILLDVGARSVNIQFNSLT